MKKKCSRCIKDIDCLSNDIQKCPCATVQLTKETTQYLSLTSYDCLCNKCLLELNIMVASTLSDGSDLKKDRDFYIENGNYVFTEYYHIKRGSCCQNECRHCAYGFSNEK